MHYELWHMMSNNLIATFDTEREALLLLKGAIFEQGESVLEELQLVEEHTEDEDPEIDSWRNIGIGPELVPLAMSTT
jgi:hypothetical protein